MGIRKLIVRNAKTGKDYLYWQADCGMVGEQRIRKAFRTRDEAQAFYRQFKRSHDRFGSEGVQLSGGELALASEAFSRLRENGFERSDLSIAVEEFLARRRKVEREVSLGEAFSEYLGTFDDGQRLNLRQVKHKVGYLVDVLGDESALSRLGTDSVERAFALLGKKKMALKSYNMHISYTRTFFNWCVGKKYIEANPMVGIDECAIPYKDPVFMRPDVVRGALSALEGDRLLQERDRRILLNFFALSFFGGARTSEIVRLGVEAVHPCDRHPFFRVSTAKGARKGVKGRIVELEPNAAAWLSKYPFEPFTSSQLGHARDRAFRGCLGAFREAFEQNVGRHSFITYHCAKFRNNARTESLVGTSSSMRVKHYQGLATTEDAEAYFAIFPCEG